MSRSALESGAEDATGLLERWIDQKTGGRVQRLRIENNAGRLIVRGRAGSYYVRQLALAAALEALEPPQFDRVQFDIEVTPRLSSSP